MKEKQIHIEAFDIYYALGDNRSLEKLHEKLLQKYSKDAPSFHTLKKWSKAFNWQIRVEQRDIENNKKLKEKLEQETNRIVVNTKADYRVEIKTANNLINKLISEIIEKDENGKPIRLKIKINSVNDLAKLFQIKDMLIKTDLNLMGENISTMNVELTSNNEWTGKVLQNKELKEELLKLFEKDG